MIPVTQPALPDAGKYARYVAGVFGRARFTNDGPLVQELSARIAEHLRVAHLILVANGTLALQVAFRVVGLRGRVATTPFSFSATTSALLWNGITPVYSDIERCNLALDPALLPRGADAAIGGIVPVHVYGIPCDYERIEAAAAGMGVPVVYDGAHAFGVDHHGRSILDRGDATALSFHATKPFHTAEGGAIVFRDRAALERARLVINHGLPAQDGRAIEVGTNAKMSELHAAVGLCILDDLPGIVERRLACAELYGRLLADHIELVRAPSSATSNGGYMPILLRSRKQRDEVREDLREAGVEARAYFFPALNDLFGLGGNDTPVATDTAERVLCLPIFDGLEPADLRRIAALVRARC
jgi:dTDP-4-amino-4,6-dideoxygalactose transaminase